MIRISLVFIFLLFSGLSLAGEPNQKPLEALPKATDMDFTCGGPGRTFYVYFDYNSAELKSSELLRLANWDVENRLSFSYHSHLTIAGAAEVGEKNARELSIKRTQVVMDFFWRTDYRKAAIIVEHNIYDLPYIDGQGFTLTELEMVPGCSE